VIPVFVKLRQERGDVQAWRLGVQLASVLLVFLLILTLVAMVAAPLYLRWLAPGFTSHELQRAAQATRFMLPAVSLMGLASLAGAILQIHRSFARPALATAARQVILLPTQI